MKELEYLETIEKTLTHNELLGDDCAVLPDFDVTMTQDTLIEDVHFKTEYTTPYLLGYKAVTVNLSDLAAGFAKPKYLMISLSLPLKIEKKFVEKFYKGVNDACEKYDVKVAGGDITGADKIYISICAIGSKPTNPPKRSKACVGDYVVTTGEHGSSACGLWLLQYKINEPADIILSHLKPEPKFVDISCECAMDTSDGLVDALYKIAKASNVSINVDFSKIPFNKTIFSFNRKYKDWVLYGAEDYQLVLCVKKDVYENSDKSKFFKIGEVVKKQKYTVKIDDYLVDEKEFEAKTYNHFEEKK